MIVNTLHSFQNYFRCKTFSPILLPHLRDCQTILDVGTSTGALASSMLQDSPNLNLTGVDVVTGSRTHIPMVIGNGKHLPFGDDAFDCVMLIDVLHHDLHPEELLSEVARVSKKRILIKDHYWESKIDHFILSSHDYIGNKPYGINLPYNFLAMQTWRKLIEYANLQIADLSKFRLNAFDLRKHIIFELEKPLLTDIP